MVVLKFAASALAFVTIAAAHPMPHDEIGAALPGRWYHESDHPVYALFRRDGPTRVRRADPSSTSSTASSSSALPSVGSAAWSAAYPQSSPDVNALPKAWTDALQDAIDSGLIPNIPVTTLAADGSPAYPSNVNGNRNNATICAATDRVCRIPDNIWDAPDGVMGIGFDDGPTSASPALYDFLQKNNQSSTHYMIGSAILSNPSAFEQAFDVLAADIAVHTWTHPHMTMLDNNHVLAELAWTMQIIHDSTGGKLPRFWRPPYGDIDMRVSSIAQEVLGLTAILWNQDTEDWSLATGGTTLDAIEKNMQKWLTGSKSPGLIILEHELTNNTVGAFETAFPLIAQNGWKTMSQAQMDSDLSVYQDGDDEDDLAFLTSTSTSADVSEPSASSGSATGSGSGSNASGTPGGSSAQASHSGADLQVVIGARQILAASAVFIIGALVAM